MYLYGDVYVYVETYVYDACIGNDDDNLDDFFHKNSELSNGMIKTGVSDERILEIATYSMSKNQEDL